MRIKCFFGFHCNHIDKQCPVYKDSVFGQGWHKHCCYCNKVLCVKCAELLEFNMHKEKQDQKNHGKYV